MNDRKMMSWLKRLAQLDVDAVATYDAAIKHVMEPEVRERLAAFRVDHVRHIQDLNDCIQKLGGEPIEQVIDLKGRAMEGLTSFTSLAGTEAALMAMLGNEELTNLTYEAALKLRGNDDARAIIKRNREDERLHLAWIKSALKARLMLRREGAEVNA